jgi:hypothetical protein
VSWGAADDVNLLNNAMLCFHVLGGLIHSGAPSNHGPARLLRESRNAVEEKCVKWSCEEEREKVVKSKATPSLPERQAHTPRPLPLEQCLPKSMMQKYALYY